MKMFFPAVCSPRFLLAASVIAATTISVPAQFTPGDLAVLRVGDGSQTLGNNGNTVFIEEYTPLGALMGSPVQIPDSGASSLIISGSASSEGALNRSSDGQYLVFAGYNTTRPGASSIVAANSATVPRAIGTLDLNRNFTLASTTSSQYSANNIRSGASDGANSFWGAGANSGTYYFGNTAPGATVQTTVANTRVVQNIGGNLYFSTASGSSLGLFSIAGSPTGPSTAAPFIVTGSGSSPYDFALSPTLTTAYIADDRSSANGGIQRWDFNGSTWSLSYTLGTGASNIGARGLAVDFTDPAPTIYATTAEGTANRLIRIVDTGAGSTAFTLATAPTGELFRGLDFTPIPEPSILALAGLSVLCLSALRRKSWRPGPRTSVRL